MKHAIVKAEPMFPVNGTTAQNEEAYLAMMISLDGKNGKVPIVAVKDYGLSPIGDGSRIGKQEVILQLIIDSPDQNIVGISTSTGISAQTVGKYILRLVDLGHVTSDIEAIGSIRRKVCNATPAGRLFAEGVS